MAQPPPRDPDLERDASTQFSFITATPPPRLLESRYDPEAFGNAVVVLAGDGIRVRVTRDRSQLFVDLSPADRADWVDEQVVLQLVGGVSAVHRLAEGEFRALAPSAAAIRRHFPEILAAFQPTRWPATRVALTQLQHERAQRLFGASG